MEEKIELFAIIELFGHQRISGHVESMSISGASFVRVDVPETKSQPKFTRIFNPSAIYAINPVTEEVAIAMAESIHQKPIEAWDIREMEKKLLALKGSGSHDFDGGGLIMNAPLIRHNIWKWILKPVNWLIWIRFRILFNQEGKNWDDPIPQPSRPVTFIEDFRKTGDQGNKPRLWSTSLPWGSWSYDQLTESMPENIIRTKEGLSLELRKENGFIVHWDRDYEFSFTSADINTFDTFNQVYGRFEICARMPFPDDRMKFYNPAIWLLTKTYLNRLCPNDNNEVILPEIDIFEHMQWPLFSFHTGYSYSKEGKLSSSMQSIRKIRFKGFHTFAIEWTPFSVKWFIDDILVNLYKGNIPHRKMYLILSMGTNSVQDPKNQEMPNLAQFTFAWVRVYGLKDEII